MDELITDEKARQGDTDAAILLRAKHRFKLSSEAEKENREAALDDLRFARLSEQWPEDVRTDREFKGRPCLTINKLPAIIRQVVNDARQNKPSIKTLPVDSHADPETSEVITDLIRNIESHSNATAAYDTALDFAVTSGLGFIRISCDFAYDDSFDEDISIERIENPASVFMDANSVAEDSRDWMYCVIMERFTRDDFKERWKNGELVDWDSLGYGNLDSEWGDSETIQVAEYWERKEIQKEIYLMSDGSVVDKEEYLNAPEEYAALNSVPEKSRMTKSYKVTQYIMTSAEILETNDWEGKYIPIVPVFGDEIFIEGKRRLTSLVRDAKDPQRMFNYWRSMATELVALAPKAPYIGPKGAFDHSNKKWKTANTESHAYIEYSGQVAPVRQPFAGVPAGALQEAMNASDDIKVTTGIFDAGMGAQSNETSGKAIMARQRESDVSNFHFQDNLTRAMRHCGRIIIDLIPKKYTGERIVRVLGEDNKEARNIQLGAATPKSEGQQQIFDLTVGKYDIVVDTGPSFTSKREESATQMMELVRAYPDAAPIIADLMASNLDWPGADDIAKRFKLMLPEQIRNQLDDGEEPDPVMMQQALAEMKQQIQEGTQILEELQKENESLKADKSIDQEKLKVDQYEAETKREAVRQKDPMTPQQIQGLVLQTLQQLQQGSDQYVR